MCCSLTPAGLLAPLKKEEEKKVILMYSMFKTEDIDGRADWGCAN